LYFIYRENQFDLNFPAINEADSKDGETATIDENQSQQIPKPALSNQDVRFQQQKGKRNARN
jgi:hypothetical protein